MHDMVMYLDQRISEIKKVVREGNDEIRVLEALLASLNPCRTCQGKGKLMMFVAQDETSLESCNVCKGTGKSTLPPGR